MGKDIKDVSVTIKVKPEIHKKLKLVSLLNEKTITAMLTEWVESLPVNISDYMVSGSDPIIQKAIKDEKNILVYNDHEIKVLIMGMVAEGKKPFSIAKKLEADGVPSARGGKWSEQTVKGMIKRWSNEDKKAAESPSEAAE